MGPTLKSFQPLITQLKNGAPLDWQAREACITALEIAAAVKDLDIVRKAEFGVAAAQIIEEAK